VAAVTAADISMGSSAATSKLSATSTTTTTTATTTTTPVHQRQRTLSRFYQSSSSDSESDESSSSSTSFSFSHSSQTSPDSEDSKMSCAMDKNIMNSSSLSVRVTSGTAVLRNSYSDDDVSRLDSATSAGPSRQNSNPTEEDYEGLNLAEMDFGENFALSGHGGHFGDICLPHVASFG